MLSKVWSAEHYSEGKDRLEQSLEEVQTGDTADGDIADTESLPCVNSSLCPRAKNL